MRRLTQSIILGAAIAIAIVPVSSAQLFQRNKDKDQARVLNGDVRNKNNEPLSGAVAYLKNKKTLTVKSAYTDDKGEFHFHALSPNVDYEVYAEYKGQRSQTKTMSSFDSRQTVNMDLTIDVAK